MMRPSHTRAWDRTLVGMAVGQIIARSVIGLCPEHLGEVQAFVAKYSTAGTVHA